MKRIALFLLATAPAWASSVNPTSLTFTLPADATVTKTVFVNPGPEGTRFTWAIDSPYFTTTQSPTTGPGSIPVFLTTAGRNVTTSVSTNMVVRIFAFNDQVNTILVPLTIVPPPPTLTVTPNAISFFYVKGSAAPAAQTANVTSTPGPLSFNLVSPGSTYFLISFAGTPVTPKTLNVTVTTPTLTLPPGRYSSFIDIVSPGTTSGPRLNLRIDIIDPFSIITTALAQATVGTAYTAALAATGGTTPYTWNATGQLPPGLTLNSNGQISGTPTAAGTYSFTVSARDSSSTQQVATRTLSITVRQPLSITTTTLPNGTVGSAYAATLAASGGATPYVWSLAAGSLPSGIVLNPTTGALTGTPAAAGTSNFTVRVTDATRTSVTRALSIAVNVPLSITTAATLTPGTEGLAYSTSLAAAGGTTPYTWTQLSGSLPPGLTLASNGQIAGTPTTRGAYTFAAGVRDSASSTANRTFTLVINPAIINLTITTAPTLPSGAEGVLYVALLNAAGGTAPYTWSIQSGTLPPGLTLATNGGIAGTPTTPGTYTFSALVRDAAATPDTATRAFTIVIEPAVVDLTVTTPPALPPATEGTAYTAPLAVAGGTPPYAWAVVEGSLPPGLTLASNGILAGTPTARGSYTFLAGVRDSAPNPDTAGRTFTLIVNPPASPLTITTAPALTPGTRGVAYTANFAATGGTPPYTWSRIAGALPAGLSLSNNGQLTGTPTESGSYAFSLSVRDAAANPAAAARTFTLVINAPANTLSVVPAVLPNAVLNAVYPAQTLGASGGTPPYSWTVAGGTLPPGITLSAAGLISGTPTSQGTFRFTAQVTDSTTATRQTAQINLAITVLPAPANLSITSLSPSSVNAGSPEFTLSVQGAGFSTASFVNWSGIRLDTTFVNATQLTARVPATLVALPGAVRIVVSDPNAPASNELTFTVNPAALEISAINPSTAVAGGPSFTLTVDGRGFTAASPFAAATVVRWNGQALDTQFVGTTRLTATVPASLIAAAGEVQITVQTPPGTPSPALTFTITAPGAPVLTSINPSTVTAGSAAFTLTVNGTGFVPQSVVRWNNQPLTTTYVDAARLTAAVPAARIAAEGEAAITVGNPANAVSGALTLTIAAPSAPQIQSIAPQSVRAGSAAFTLTVDGANFLQSSTVLWNTTRLATTFVSATRLTAGVPAALVAQQASIDITVDGSAAARFTVEAAIPNPELTGLDALPTVTGTTSVGVRLTTEAPVDVEGTLILSFRPNAAGVDADYRDPALQFASGGTTVNFTIPAGQSVAALPSNGAIQPGTVSGDIVATVTRFGPAGQAAELAPAPTRTLTIPRSAPVIVPGSVRLVNVTATGFDVQLDAYATPREVTGGTFSFAVAGGTLDGQAAFTVDLNSTFTQWYASAQSRDGGSTFRLRVPFTFTGSSSILTSVTATLANSAGASAAVTGTR